MTETIHPEAPRRRRRIAGTLATLALASTALTGILWQQGMAASPSDTPPAIVMPRAMAPSSFADLAERVSPAVVRIAVTGTASEPQSDEDGKNLPPFMRRFAEPQRRVRGEGSGFIVDPSGIIVTNNHVVGSAQTVTVTLTDGREIAARVLGKDARTDLAVIKIDADGPLPTVAFSDDSSARVGDWVMAMGNPFGLGGTVTAGIISARGRQIGAGPYDDFIQTDAPINPGNSGGPLFDLHGQVVGVNTAIFSPSGGSIGIGFAIPSSIAAHVVSQLREHGSVERGFLGVTLQTLSPAMAQALGRPDRKGALVAAVEPNSPAQQAGIREGDLLLAFGGTAVVNAGAVARAAADAKPGESSTVELWRDGSSRTVTLRIGTQPQQQREANAGQQSGPQSLGLALAPAPKGADEAGAVIAAVQPDGPGAEAGLRPGDLIIRAGNAAVTRPEDVIRALASARSGGKEALLLQVARGGQHSFVAIPLKAA
ncbi:serine protease Do [Humitalea rosea]|uniref:Serine protease Do n=1 Tax=Humitalea rosea TaxID=990373 RepID=A0A2W7J011_9PROT|nr:Do family serine endopeptidase [Humitalea rosea]PZW44947.1 serine protease Do [Humitalea rosea]